jgi:hypothetical protein
VRDNRGDGFAEVGDQYPYLDQQSIGQQDQPPVRDPGWTVPEQDPPRDGPNEEPWRRP